jgi:hypothetical protein
LGGFQFIAKHPTLVEALGPEKVTALKNLRKFVLKRALDMQDAESLFSDADKDRILAFTHF